MNLINWNEIRYRTFHPAPYSVSGLQLLSDDGGARRAQLVPAAGAADDSPDQKETKVQWGYTLAADVEEGTGATEKVPMQRLARHRVHV